MRVLQIGKFYPPVVGGIETVTYDLTQGLNAGGVPTDVLCSHVATKLVIEESDSGNKVIRMPTFCTSASTPLSPGMPACFRRIMNDYDIIHVHLPNPMANLTLLLSGYDGKVLLHWHSDIIQQKKLLRLYKPLQSWLLRRADAIIATSPPYIDSSPFLSQWREKVKVVPLGINSSRLLVDNGVLENLRRRHKGRRIVFSLGRMAYYKGYQYLIDAALHTPDDVIIIIGGAGKLLSDLRSRIENLGLGNKVELVGNIQENELGAYFEIADVFCLPSIARSEAFGVVMLEAMACGRPIIATDIPGSGVPWVNIDGLSGINVEPGDSRALADAIMRLLKDEALLKKLGGQALKRFEENFTAEGMVQATRQLYENILA
jgi:rhamnosyl/mannosyltransferase